MKAKLVKQTRVAPGVGEVEGVEYDERGRRWYSIGTILEGPDAYRLVQMGVAEPADDECTVRACMTSAEMKKAQRHQDMVSKGIHPEDYQRYLDGELAGYDAEGNDIPGPNAIGIQD